MAKTKRCECCGVTTEKRATEAEWKWQKRRFCSPRCYHRAKIKPTEAKVCEQCRESFERPPGLATTEWVRRRFCSKDCKDVVQAVGGSSPLAHPLRIGP